METAPILFKFHQRKLADYLSSWRGLARAGKLVVPDFPDGSFATVVFADALPQPPPAQDRIELVVGGITLRLDAATPPVLIAELAAALRAAL